MMNKKTKTERKYWIKRFAMAALGSGKMPHGSHEFQENANWCKCQAKILLEELERGEPTAKTSKTTP